VALANVIGAGLCFAFADQFAKIALVRAGILVPMVLAITYIGAYQGSRDLNDLVVLVGFGLVAWVMKRQGWPRPPVILGFVLGDLIEGYMFISYNRYGFEWLLHPGVVVIGTILILVLLRPLLSRLWNRDAAATAAARMKDDKSPGGLAVNLFLWVLCASIFVYAFVSSLPWQFAARLMPQVVAAIGIVVVAAAIIKELVARFRATPSAAEATAVDGGPRSYRVREADPLDALGNVELLKRSAAIVAWLVGLTALIYLIGILPAALIFMAAYFVIEGQMMPARAALVSAVYVLAMFVLFDRILHMPWPNALIGDLWPQLRDIVGLRLL
jgi:hypothetical protein